MLKIGFSVNQNNQAVHFIFLTSVSEKGNANVQFASKEFVLLKILLQNITQC